MSEPLNKASLDLIQEWAEEAQKGGYDHVSMLSPDAVLALIDAALPSPETTPAGVLDEAWEAAEKALPEGASVGVTKTVNVASGPYVATTDYGPVEHGYAYGPTPAAALHALAAALGRSGSGGGRG